MKKILFIATIWVAALTLYVVHSWKHNPQFFKIDLQRAKEEIDFTENQKLIVETLKKLSLGDAKGATILLSSCSGEITNSIEFKNAKVIYDSSLSGKGFLFFKKPLTTDQYQNLKNLARQIPDYRNKNECALNFLVRHYTLKLWYSDIDRYKKKPGYEIESLTTLASETIDFFFNGNHRFLRDNFIEILPLAYCITLECRFRLSIISVNQYFSYDSYNREKFFRAYTEILQKVEYEPLLASILGAGGQSAHYVEWLRDYKEVVSFSGELIPKAKVDILLGMIPHAKIITGN